MCKLISWHFPLIFHIQPHSMIVLYYSGLFGPLLKLLATHFPHLTLVEDWLDDMSLHLEYKQVHLSEFAVVEAFNEMESKPSKCARLLRALLVREAIDIWPYVEVRFYMCILQIIYHLQNIHISQSSCIKIFEST